MTKIALRKNAENSLQDLTKISGPGAVVINFDDLPLSRYISTVGPAPVILHLRELLLSTKADRDVALRVIRAPWFPAGEAIRHEMAFRELKNRLWLMSEARYDETLQTLMLIRTWKGRLPLPSQIEKEDIDAARNLGSFYNLFYPGLLARLG